LSSGEEERQCAELAGRAAEVLERLHALLRVQGGEEGNQDTQATDFILFFWGQSHNFSFNNIYRQSILSIAIIFLPSYIIPWWYSKADSRFLERFAPHFNYNLQFFNS
jgi:hypothetical protein